MKRGGSKVKVVAPSEERRRILKACHSEPTSYRRTKELQSGSTGKG